MSSPASFRWDREVRLLAWLAACVSVFSFLTYFQRGEVLLYGDAIAHINIARRVFDSRTPGLLQLGTVWLPLPHLLMIPFLISHKMWQEGTGGSVPSLAAFVFGVVGIFRLVRAVLLREGKADSAAHIGAWTAAVAYGANPNLIYMQTTAMGESLYLALFIWTLVYFSEFVRGEAKALTKCGLCLAAACLTRYDGWFLGAVIAFVVVVRSIAWRTAKGSGACPPPDSRGRLSPHKLWRFLLIVAAVPVFWLAYNAVVYRNPLEFANGPYSAEAIEKRTQSTGSPGHPGTANAYVAGLYFLKAAEFNLAENEWLGRAWVLLVVVTGVMMPVSHTRKKSEDGALASAAPSSDSHSSKNAKHATPSCWALLLLCLPLPFYALSVAYAGVPIFVPAWWPFTHYNLRYGLELLPAFATGAGVLVAWGLRSEAWRGFPRRVGVPAVGLLVVASYASVWRAGPVCLREAQINMRGRNTLEQQLAKWLAVLPPDSTLLMYLGDHVGAVERAGVPLKRVINEGNHRVWKQPTDPEGLWERALADPAAYADYVLGFEGDRVWQAVQGRHLKELVEIHTTGQARAILYRAR
jgi:hypothetical protein